MPSSPASSVHASEVALSDLPPGQWAEIVRVQGPPRWRRRLYALGFVPGAAVYVEHAAPLGDPVQYRVRDTWLALRRQTARHIWVRPLAQGPARAEHGSP